MVLGAKYFAKVKKIYGPFIAIQSTSYVVSVQSLTQLPVYYTPLWAYFFLAFALSHTLRRGLILGCIYLYWKIDTDYRTQKYEVCFGKKIWVTQAPYVKQRRKQTLIQNARVFGLIVTLMANKINHTIEYLYE